MSKDVTMEAIEELFDYTFDEKLEPIKKTLREHSAALEELLLDKKKREENQQVHDFEV